MKATVIAIASGLLLTGCTTAQEPVQMESRYCTFEIVTNELGGVAVSKSAPRGESIEQALSRCARNLTEKGYTVVETGATPVLNWTVSRASRLFQESLNGKARMYVRGERPVSK